MLTAILLTAVLSQPAHAATPEPILTAHATSIDPGEGAEVLCGRFPKLPLCR